MNPTYLAHIQKDGQDDWIESNEYANGELLSSALRGEGYQVVSVTDLEDIKTW